VVEITYDPEIMDYEEMIKIYWQQIDPTDDGGQFHDRGDSYRTAIFYHDENQKLIAEATREELAKSGRFSKPIVTKILAAETFYPAEAYHQDYYQKNSEHYLADRAKSGRDEFIEKNWQ